VRYIDRTVPISYHCSKCPAVDVKLWRQYNTFADHIELLCAACALVDQKKNGLVDNLGYHHHDQNPPGDQIGGLVPSVPTENDDTFWGYTSVPALGVMWWKLLPTSQPDTTANATERVQMALKKSYETLADLEEMSSRSPYLATFIPDTQAAIVMATEAMRSLS
jgi:hypothetical protein